MQSTQWVLKLDLPVRYHTDSGFPVFYIFNNGKPLCRWTPIQKLKQLIYKVNTRKAAFSGRERVSPSMTFLHVNQWDTIGKVHFCH